MACACRVVWQRTIPAVPLKALRSYCEMAPAGNDDYSSMMHRAVFEDGELIINEAITSAAFIDPGKTLTLLAQILQSMPPEAQSPEELELGPLRNCSTIIP